MTTISQRELRNESGRVLREVEQGGEFTITRRGTPVARIVPLEGPAGNGLSHRPARRRAVFSIDDMVRSQTPSQKILDELREER